MWKPTLLVLATLAVALRAEDMKYSTLKEHVVNLDMAVTYKVKGKECTFEDRKCGGEKFNSDSEAVVSVEFKEPGASRWLDEFNGAKLEAPTEIQFKACYAADWIVDRKWRKAKDIIKDDKRCSKKIGTWEIDDPMKVEFKLPTDTPTADWFIVALLKCPEAEDKGLVVCGFDYTGRDEKFLEDKPGSSEAYYPTSVIDSRTTGLYIAVIVMSAASVSLLIGFFVYEQMTKKNK